MAATYAPEIDTMGGAGHMVSAEKRCHSCSGAGVLHSVRELNSLQHSGHMGQMVAVANCLQDAHSPCDSVDSNNVTLSDGDMSSRINVTGM